jgi:hypothetical protein
MGKITVIISWYLLKILERYMVIKFIFSLNFHIWEIFTAKIKNKLSPVTEISVCLQCGIRMTISEQLHFLSVH